MCRTPPPQNHVTLSEREGPYTERGGEQHVSQVALGVNIPPGDA
jgi:hypothetical protein